MIADNKDDIFNIINSWNKVDSIREMTDAIKCELRSEDEAEFYYDSVEKANLAVKILQNNNYIILQIYPDGIYSARNHIVRIKL